MNCRAPRLRDRHVTTHAALTVKSCSSRRYLFLLFSLLQAVCWLAAGSSPRPLRYVKYVAGKRDSGNVHHRRAFLSLVREPFDLSQPPRSSTYVLEVFWKYIFLPLIFCC